MVVITLVEDEPDSRAQATAYAIEQAASDADRDPRELLLEAGLATLASKWGAFREGSIPLLHRDARRIDDLLIGHGRSPPELLDYVVYGIYIAHSVPSHEFIPGLNDDSGFDPRAASATASCLGRHESIDLHTGEYLHKIPTWSVMHTYLYGDHSVEGIMPTRPRDPPFAQELRVCDRYKYGSRYSRSRDRPTSYDDAQTFAAQQALNHETRLVHEMDIPRLQELAYEADIELARLLDDRLIDRALAAYEYFDTAVVHDRKVWHSSWTTAKFRYPLREALGKLHFYVTHQGDEYSLENRGSREFSRS